MEEFIKKYIIVFYTCEPKEAEIFNENQMRLLFLRIVQLTKSKAKYAIYEVGECVGDFS